MKCFGAALADVEIEPIDLISKCTRGNSEHATCIGYVDDQDWLFHEYFKSWRTKFDYVIVERHDKSKKSISRYSQCLNLS